MNKTTAARQANTASFLPPVPGQLQRKCACGNHTVAGGECAACAKNTSGLQRKLSIGASNDPLELEADRVAEQLTAVPAHSAVSAAPLHIQRYAGQASGDAETAAPASVDHVLAGSGRPLEPALRQDMEQRFGNDFSRVRVHSGGAAEQSARDVNANAYTVGHNIVFGAGRFAPGTHEGRRLIAHELTHVVQQSCADRIPINQSPVQGDLVSSSPGQVKPVVSSGMQRMLRRDMGFEFQTKNLVIGDKGRKFPSKFGGFLHKVPPSDKHGVELQTDTGSVIEFETYHFRKWSDLQGQIQNAVDVVQEIKKKPKAFPFNQAKRLASEGLLKKGEKLEVDIKDPTFVAAIQSTEGFALVQYESSLKEHERSGFVNPVIKKAQNILTAAQKANTKMGSAKVDSLRSFLQVIVNYILNAQDRPSSDTRVSPVKARFRLMSRTSFSAMFNSVLNADEQTLFKQIVQNGAIPQELGLAGTDQFFSDGYWGHMGDMWALFQGGKVVALATEDKKTIHDCSSKKKTPGIDLSKCGNKVAGTEITIGGWLDSIVKQKKDALSPPAHGGSGSMGKFDVPSKGEEKGLVVFEARGESMRTRSQPVDKWLDYAEDVFRQAAVCRGRPGTGTELIYDGSKKFDPKNCP